MAVDLLIPLATTFRLLFAVGFWLVLIGSIAGLLVWPALRRLTLEDVALRIERTVGGMHNRLLTVLDLHRADAAGKKQSNPDMVARLLWQTRNKLADFHIRQIVNPVPLLRSLAGLVAVLLVAVLLAVVFRESAPTALARILRPTADIPPVTWLQIAAPGELAVPAGDPLTIGVDVTRGEVDALSLHLQQPDGHWVVYPMQRDGEQRFSLHAQRRDGRLSLQDQRRRHLDERISDPHGAAADRRCRRPFRFDCPRYMQRDDRLPVADDARRIEAPIDSHLVLAAAVSGDVARGEIVLLKRSVETHDEVQDEEHVWFEDDLPADAETERALAVEHRPGLHGLEIVHLRPHPSAVRLHHPAQSVARAGRGNFLPDGLARCRRSAGPHHLAACEHDNQTRAFEWGENSTPASRSAPAGPSWLLPQPARWARLEVPADALGAIPAGVKLRGMSLEIDRGQVFFDRPGYLIRSSRPVETVRTETVDTLPMQRDEASGRWLGEVPVAVDRLLTVRFHSALGQASADREPLELIATKDQPPSIVVEKPGLDVVLPAVQPLPISARVLDDWGIAAVGIQLGPSETALSSVRWQTGDVPSWSTSRNITLAIDPKAEHLAPGQYLVVSAGGQGLQRTNRRVEDLTNFRSPRPIGPARRNGQAPRVARATACKWSSQMAQGTAQRSRVGRIRRRLAAVATRTGRCPGPVPQTRRQPAAGRRSSQADREGRIGIDARAKNTPGRVDRRTRSPAARTQATGRDAQAGGAKIGGQSAGARSKTRTCSRSSPARPRRWRPI